MEEIERAGKMSSLQLMVQRRMECSPRKKSREERDSVRTDCQANEDKPIYLRLWPQKNVDHKVDDCC